MDGFGSVYANEPHTLASSQQQCISVNDSLNVFKLARRYAWVWWIEKSGKQRNENEARQRPFPAESVVGETRVHGDAFSTSAVKASRRTCCTARINLILPCSRIATLVYFSP